MNQRHFSGVGGAGLRCIQSEHVRLGLEALCRLSSPDDIALTLIGPFCPSVGTDWVIREWKTGRLGYRKLFRALVRDSIAGLADLGDPSEWRL